jgi:hypothetical protein
MASRRVDPGSIALSDLFVVAWNMGGYAGMSYLRFRLSSSSWLVSFSWCRILCPVLNTYWSHIPSLLPNSSWMLHMNRWFDVNPWRVSHGIDISINCCKFPSWINHKKMTVN